jgi:hypothetical protein
MRALLLIFGFVGIVAAQPPERRVTFLEYSTELFISALKEAKGLRAAIPKETLQRHAVAMFKHLVGEPRAGQKLIAHVPPEPEGSPRSKEEFVYFVGYDTGLTGGGCEFHFRHGELHRVTIVHGQ